MRKLDTHDVAGLEKFAPQVSPAGPVSESRFDYDATRKTVIESSPNGKRYVVGVRNTNLQRLKELKDPEKPGLISDLRELPSR
jgi:hypothetical protein